MTDAYLIYLSLPTNQIESITHSESELLLVKTVRGGTY